MIVIPQSNAITAKITGGPSTKNPIKNETEMLVLNTKKAEKILNWKTRLNVEAATILTIEWYKKFYKNKKEITNFTREQIINYHKKIKI